MRVICITCLMLISLLATGCATVSKPKVEKLSQKKAVVSKTIEAERNHKYSGLKRKVAIARFTNETKYGQSFFIDKNANPVGKQAVDILSKALLDSEKFILLERADLNQISQELKLGNVSKLSNMADYLVVGSVSEFGRKEKGKVGIFSRTKEQVAFAKVHVRLIDVRTGQVIYAEEGEGESSSEAGSILGVGSRAGYDSTLNDKALEAAIMNLSSNIIENLLDKPWRTYILARQGAQIIVSGGRTQGIHSGDTFAVMRRGKVVVNPQTNMSITLPGTQVATLKVVTCAGDTPQNEVSFCKVVKGDVPQKGKFAEYYVEERL